VVADVRPFRVLLVRSPLAPRCPSRTRPSTAASHCLHSTHTAHYQSTRVSISDTTRVQVFASITGQCGSKWQAPNQIGPVPELGTNANRTMAAVQWALG